MEELWEEGTTTNGDELKKKAEALLTLRSDLEGHVYDSVKSSLISSVCTTHSTPCALNVAYNLI